MPVSRQQRSYQQPYQPVYVIPLGAAAAPVEPIIVEQASNTRPTSYPLVPTIAPKLDAPIVSSSEAVKGKRPLLPLDDRELRRRVKKQNMERRRRACISDKLAALHSLAVSLVGEEPQQRSQQRTEITDILNQCVRVLQSLSELVKSEPELQLKLRRLELPSAKESSEEQRRRRQNSTSMLKEKVIEEEKENESPHPSGPKAADRNRVVITSTPLEARPLLPPPPRQQHECTPEVGCRKRESTDSGLDCHTFPSPEASTVFSPFTPSTSSLVKTQSLKRFQKSSDIWRPYL
ncbi:hypothetical protein TcWFU_002205 [Taenia crassiceps]|uniref:BHLH domain-containing protein n=1 Tax=Taenia crassiceps TaxID=6207 RepID=A0ABR4QGY6_9CEST